MSWREPKCLFLTGFAVGSTFATVSAILGQLSRTTSLFGAPLGFELFLFSAVSALAIVTVVAKSPKLNNVLHHFALVSLIVALFYIYSLFHVDYEFGSGSRPLHTPPETTEKMIFYAYWRDVLQLVGLCVMGFSYMFVFIDKTPDRRPANSE